MRSILENTSWNILGNVTPAACALVAIPYLTSTIGTQSFGVLSLVWVLIGYFSFFDFGIGRAITKFVAELSVHHRTADINQAASDALGILTLIGILASVLLALLYVFCAITAPSLPLLHYQSTTFVVLLSIPVVVLTSGIKGVLEGLQDFRNLNLMRMPVGILFFLLPCLLASVAPTLLMATVGVFLARLFGLALHFLVLHRRVPLHRLPAPRLSSAAGFLRFGGWLTVSSFIGPIIVYLDRFLIGALLSTGVLAYYTAPFEALSRLLILPTSFTSALFPELAIQLQRSSRDGGRLMTQATLITAAVLTPILIVGLATSRQALGMWLGPDFAERSGALASVLLVGFSFNSLAQIPYSVLQGMNRTREAAFLHLAELAPYALLAYVLISSHGLLGAAIAWAVRAFIDMLLMFALCRPLYATQPANGHPQ